MSRSEVKIRVPCVYGNQKQGGFVRGCAEHIAERLEEKGVETDRLRLGECAIGDCFPVAHTNSRDVTLLFIKMF